MSSLEITYLNRSKCSCSPTNKCETSSVIFDEDYLLYYKSSDYLNVSHVIPGSTVGCINTDSLFLSTLECFYSDSIYFHILKKYVEQSFLWNSGFIGTILLYGHTMWFDATPMVYNSTPTDFYRNSSISTMIRNLFIERWNPSYSYNNLYQSCSPDYCSFQERIHTNNVIGIIVVLISTIGGLIILIRLITPYLVMFSIQLISIITRKKRQQQQPPQPTTQQPSSKRLIIVVERK